MSLSINNQTSVNNDLAQTLNRLYPEIEIREIAKQLFIDTWAPIQSLSIDFDKLGVTELPIDLSDCLMEYEFIGGGQLLVLTTYINQEAMDKDAEFTKIALQHKAVTIKGLQTAILYDKQTSIIVRQSIIKARSK